MDEDKFILVHPGFWEGSLYRVGEEVMVFTSLQTISFTDFLVDVHKIVQADRRFFDYMLHYLARTEDYGLMKSIILSDRDLQRVARIFKTPKIFVSLKPKHDEWGYPLCGSQSQGAYVNPFAYGGQPPSGFHYPPPYYFSTPCFPGALPNSAPVVNQQRPSSAPIVNQPRPNSTLIVDQPKPSLAPIVNKPPPKPSSTPAVNKSKPMSMPVVNQPRPSN